MNRTARLRDEGQSLWLDYIRRQLLTSGELQELIEEDGLRGMTSNPSIFQKAIGETDEYDGDLKALVEARPDADAAELFETLAVEEIRRACDLLRPVYDDATSGGDAYTGSDGLVSLEVSPHLAKDTDGTIEEARRLWRTVGRPNVMIKVPATEEGLPAIEQLISEGINVNITLMFSMEDYERTAEAYLRGLERRAEEGEDVSDIHSVASFFISRISVKADAQIEEISDKPDFDGGDIAIANAKLVYQRFKEIFQEEERFADLREAGALAQRPLWASTSTKNDAYSDVRYVEELVGRHTVNTIPPKTLEAFRDHGEVRGQTVEEDLDRAKEILDTLPEYGIDLGQITHDVQEEGIDKFSDPFDELLETIEEERARFAEETPAVTYELSGALQEQVNERLDAWQQDDFAARLWERDPTLWGDEDTPELANRLGWLGLPMLMDEEAGVLMRSADAVKDQFDDVVVCGMGGSSLAPQVFGAIFESEGEAGRRGSEDGHAAYPRLSALDSTHPDAVRALTERLDLGRTLFVIASKSGTTTETRSFFQYFWDEVSEQTDAPGDHFAAVTDPGTELAELGQEHGFQQVFTTTPDVGGRYAAFTHFGLVPAALGGVDLHALLSRARRMAEASGAERDAPSNAGLRLGAALGEAQKAGRDKVTFSTSPALESFPAWLEQLIAESTGKDDTGIVPVAGEPPADPSTYSGDRLFVHFQLAGDEGSNESGNASSRLDALEAAGHPVVRIRLADRGDLAREMFRWEIATAAAGAALGIHPFNQPNVEAAKRLAKEAMQSGGANGEQIEEVEASDADALRDAVRDWMQNGNAGDYFSVQAYVAPSAGATAALQDLTGALAGGTGHASTWGFGPRFLHSTGQLHKGGPNTVQVLQIVDTASEDVDVPDRDYTFGELIAAQSVGDYRALAERDRRILRVDLGTGDPGAGLDALLKAVEDAPAKATV